MWISIEALVIGTMWMLAAFWQLVAGEAIGWNGQ
jgi:hypothetical protein